MKVGEIYESRGLIDGAREFGASRQPEERDDIKAHEPQKSPQSGTEVAISETSVERSKAANMMSAEPVERLEKVNELKRRVGGGVYRIDAARVADKILEDIVSHII